MKGILWFKSPQRSGYGSLNAFKICYKRSLSMKEKTRMTKDAFHPQWKYEEWSLYSMACTLCQCSEGLMAWEDHYWTTNLGWSISRCLEESLQIKIRFKDKIIFFFFTNQVKVRSGLGFSHKSRKQSLIKAWLGPYKLFGWDFRHRLKLTFLNSCSPFRVWIWIRKKNNLKLFFYYRKEWLNKLVHLVRLYYIWGYGSGRNQSFNVQRSRLKSQTGCSQKSNT